MSALEEYQKEHDRLLYGWSGTKLADAAIAELQATIDDLRTIIADYKNVVIPDKQATIEQLIQERNKAIDELMATNIELEATIERLQSLVAVEQGSSMAAAIWKQRAEQAERERDEENERWVQAQNERDEARAELAVRGRMLRLAYDVHVSHVAYAATYEGWLADLRARAEEEK